MKTIAAIRTKDPRVYDSKKEFFVGEEIEKAKKNWEEKQKQTGKKMTLKDYHRGVLLEDGGIIDEDDEEMAPAPKTHVQEQEEMKSDFKRAIMADDEEEDGFFTMRDKTSDDLAAEEEDYKRFLLESMAVSIRCVKFGEGGHHCSALTPIFFDRTIRLERTLLLTGKTIEKTRMSTRMKHF
jgi:protein KRI1